LLNKEKKVIFGDKLGDLPEDKRTNAPPAENGSNPGEPPTSKPSWTLAMSAAATVQVRKLRQPIESIRRSGYDDGCLPILRDGRLYGLIPEPNLRWALDRVYVSDDETIDLSGTDPSKLSYHLEC
jgi:hypothetical protein